MTPLTLFLPCAAGVEDFLADEVHGLTGLAGQDLLTLRGGVRVRGDWALALRLNLASRLAQRVLIELAHAPCQSEHDLYALAAGVPWEDWFTPRHTFRVDLTAQASPLQSLNFATLRVKDAVADRFRQQAGGVRPSIDTQRPDVRVQAHLSSTHATLYIDTSGEPLFKRGWRQDKGDAPLKETLAAAMLAASGWWRPATREVSPLPLYDPCCGSGTIVIEAAQIALGLPAGGQRRFAVERLRPFDAAEWVAIKKEATGSIPTKVEGQFGSETAAVRIFGSDVAHRMVDFAQRNAERAGVAAAVQLRGGDALQRLPPAGQPGVLLMNPPYGERIAAAGVAGHKARGGREAFQRDAGDAPADFNAGDEFFQRLAAHWKTHYAGWTAWLLTPDLKLPGRLRLKESRRVPLWNGPIECRMFRFDLTARRPAESPQ
ncbi:THUMP domain-containing protein [Ottowia sp.]|uniref:THUMP domain-containing class I SAM-dependent RNA methyltransferase n=1 Tax=Ottowia sp. TaxID=1898956 RepID=UPI0025D7D063|nr:THUMP domain-containing protein [Ottowia sp.]MBK6745722.1 class I SAM-dependent RNA methyltransferase [Ottowia sp.]